MSFSCFTRVPTNIRIALRRRLRAPFPLLLVGLVVLLPARPVHAAEIYYGLDIDLREVSRLYDSLYRDRITNELIDSTATFDWQRIPIGNQRHRIKTFLPTDYSTTRQVTDYTVIPGYRARFTVPVDFPFRTYNWEFNLEVDRPIFSF